MPDSINGVLLLGNFLSAATGTRGVSEDLAEQLASRGWIVTCASKQPNRVLRLFDMVFAIISNRNHYQAAGVEVYSGLAFSWAEIACGVLRRFQKPYLITLHGGRLPEFSERHPKRFRNLLLSAPIVATPSRYLQSYFATVRSDIHYLPNAIHLSNYSFRLREKAKPDLCWLRAFHEIYSPEIAIEVISKLADEFPEIKLTMVGPDNKDGSMVRAVEQAEKLGVRERIIFAGAVKKSDVPMWLDKADIFVNTTRYESFGVSVLEAAASGMCLVTTDAGELNYLWEHDHDALMTPVGDADAMAGAVRRILLERGLAGRLSCNARRKAERFDWSSVFPDWENLIAEVIQ